MEVKRNQYMYKKKSGVLDVSLAQIRSTLENQGQDPRSKHSLAESDQVNNSSSGEGDGKKKKKGSGSTGFSGLTSHTNNQVVVSRTDRKLQRLLSDGISMTGATMKELDDVLKAAGKEEKGGGKSSSTTSAGVGSSATQSRREKEKEKEALANDSAKKLTNIEIIKKGVHNPLRRKLIEQGETGNNSGVNVATSEPVCLWELLLLQHRQADGTSKTPEIPNDRMRMHTQSAAAGPSHSPSNSPKASPLEKPLDKDKDSAQTTSDVIGGSKQPVAAKASAAIDMTAMVIKKKLQYASTDASSMVPAVCFKKRLLHWGKLVPGLRERFLRWEVIKMAMIQGLHNEGIIREEGEGRALCIPLKMSQVDTVDASWVQRQNNFLHPQAQAEIQKIWREISYRGGVQKPTYFALSKEIICRVFVHLNEREIHQLILQDMDSDLPGGGLMTQRAFLRWVTAIVMVFLESHSVGEVVRCIESISEVWRSTLDNLEMGFVNRYSRKDPSLLVPSISAKHTATPQAILQFCSEHLAMSVKIRFGMLLSNGPGLGLGSGKVKKRKRANDGAQDGWDLYLNLEVEKVSRLDCVEDGAFVPPEEVELIKNKQQYLSVSPSRGGLLAGGPANAKRRSRSISMLMMSRRSNASLMLGNNNNPPPAPLTPLSGRGGLGASSFNKSMRSDTSSNAARSPLPGSTSRATWEEQINNSNAAGCAPHYDPDDRVQLARRRKQQRADDAFMTQVRAQERQSQEDSRNTTIHMSRLQPPPKYPSRREANANNDKYSLGDCRTMDMQDHLRKEEQAILVPLYRYGTMNGTLLIPRGTTVMGTFNSVLGRSAGFPSSGTKSPGAPNVSPIQTGTKVGDEAPSSPTSPTSMSGSLAGWKRGPRGSQSVLSHSENTTQQGGGETRPQSPNTVMSQSGGRGAWPGMTNPSLQLMSLVQPALPSLPGATGAKFPAKPQTRAATSFR